MTEKGVQAADSLVESGSPWHHVANVPFQCVCTLLAIDTVRSFSVLANAMSCLATVARKWPTKAMEDVSAAARVLVYIHRKRREADIQKQSDMLRLYPDETPALGNHANDTLYDQAFDGIPWFNELIPDFEFGAFAQFQDQESF